MTGGSLSVARINGPEFVGYSGTGTFTQTGGTNNIGSAALFTLATTPAVSECTPSAPIPVVLNGAANEFVGSGGTGIFIRTGGSNTFALAVPRKATFMLEMAWDLLPEWKRGN